MTIFVSIDLENPSFNVYKLSYWLWERLNGKKGTFVRRLPLDPPSPPCVVPRLQKFLTHPLFMYGRQGTLTGRRWRVIANGAACGAHWRHGRKIFKC